MPSHVCVQVERLQRKFATIHTTLAQQPNQPNKQALLDPALVPSDHTPRASAALNTILAHHGSAANNNSSSGMLHTATSLPSHASVAPTGIPTIPLGDVAAKVSSREGGGKVQYC